MISGYCNFFGRSYDFEVFRQTCDGIAMTHPNLRTYFNVAKQRVRFVYFGEDCAAVFTRRCRFYGTSGFISHQLSAIAYTQNGIMVAQTVKFGLKRFFVIDRERTT